MLHRSDSFGKFFLNSVYRYSLTLVRNEIQRYFLFSNGSSIYRWLRGNKEESEDHDICHANGFKALAVPATVMRMKLL